MGYQHTVPFPDTQPDETLRLTVDYSLHAAALFHPATGKLLHTNHAFRSIFGTHVFEEPAFYAAVMDALAQNQPVHNLEFPLWGESVWVLASAQAVTYENQAAVLLVLVDISERKAHEHHMLERERVDILSRFIRDASHEFRTPLATIRNSAYIMGRTCQVNQHCTYLRRINAESDRILRLVEALTTMSHLDGDGALLDWEIDMAELLRQAVVELKPDIDGRGQRVCFQLADVTLYGDPDLIEMAFLQLIDNATRYSADGAEIFISLSGNDREATVQIRDEGEGISPDLQELVFNSFYRLDDAHTTRGFGLGLPLARKIMERHGGMLTLVSVPGEGSTLCATLPRG